MQITVRTRSLLQASTLPNQAATLLFLHEEKCNWLKSLFVRTHKMHQQAAASCLMHTEDVHEYNYIDARQRQLVLDNAMRHPATSSRGRTNSL
jgi:hypothetical protein